MYKHLALLWAAVLLPACAPAASERAESSGPAPAPASRPSPEVAERWNRHFLEYPDVEGPLSVRLKVRLEADAWDELVAKVKPTLTFPGTERREIPDGSGRAMMWIVENPAGKPTIRLEQAYTWRPQGERAPEREPS